MSTKALYHLQKLRPLNFLKSNYIHGEYIIHADVKQSLVKCPICGNTNVPIYDHRKRLFIGIPTGTKHVHIEVNIPRVYCHNCDTVSQISLPFADPRNSYTRPFARYIIHEVNNSSIKYVSDKLHYNWDLVYTIYSEYLKSKFSKIDVSKLKYIAIDEISVSKNHKYFTIVLNLLTKRVLFVGEGKNAAALADFWSLIGPRRANKIKAVSIDMSSAYINAVTKNLKKAVLVFDHFHVVKYLNEQITILRRQLYNKANKEGKLALKGTRWVLLKNNDDLSKDEKKRLKSILKINAPLYELYVLKEDIRNLWNAKNKKDARIILQNWVDTALRSETPLMHKIANFLDFHEKGILNWFDHRISSGPLEGLNNKIKVLKRQSYGIRNIEFFKLRIYGIHDSFIFLSGS